MPNKTAPFVRFRVTNPQFGWWHINAGENLTRCGIRIPTDSESIVKYLDFANRAEGDFCTRCRPIH